MKYFPGYFNHAGRSRECLLEMWNSEACEIENSSSYSYAQEKQSHQSSLRHKTIQLSLWLASLAHYLKSSLRADPHRPTSV